MLSARTWQLRGAQEGPGLTVAAGARAAATPEPPQASSAMVAGAGCSSRGALEECSGAVRHSAVNWDLEIVGSCLAGSGGVCGKGSIVCR